jgi:hypothetical protein
MTWFPDEKTRKLSEDFLRDCGLEPTPDAIGQLTAVFIPALEIMCRRGYDPNGLTWREAGWRGQLLEIRKKAHRLWHRSWLRGAYDADSAIDLVNYAGFYYRLRCEGKPWGEWGEPGSEGEAVDEVAMGNYHDITGA